MCVVCATHVVMAATSAAVSLVCHGVSWNRDISGRRVTLLLADAAAMALCVGCRPTLHLVLFALAGCCAVFVFWRGASHVVLQHLWCHLSAICCLWVGRRYVAERCTPHTVPRVHSTCSFSHRSGLLGVGGARECRAAAAVVEPSFCRASPSLLCGDIWQKDGTTDAAVFDDADGPLGALYCG